MIVMGKLMKSTKYCGLCGDVPVEICNGVDDDCDGFLDEDLNQQCIGCGVGIEYCSVGTMVGCTGSQFCDGQDNDCDGLIDEDLIVFVHCN